MARIHCTKPKGVYEKSIEHSLKDLSHSPLAPPSSSSMKTTIFDDISDQAAKRVLEKEMSIPKPICSSKVLIVAQAIGQSICDHLTRREYVPFYSDMLPLQAAAQLCADNPISVCALVSAYPSIANALVNQPLVAITLRETQWFLSTLFGVIYQTCHVTLQTTESLSPQLESQFHSFSKYADCSLDSESLARRYPADKFLIHMHLSEFRHISHHELLEDIAKSFSPSCSEETAPFINDMFHFTPSLLAMLLVQCASDKSLAHALFSKHPFACSSSMCNFRRCFSDAQYSTLCSLLKPYLLKTIEHLPPEMCVSLTATMW